MWGGGGSTREVPVLGLTLTPGPVGEEPNGPRATMTHVGLLTSIKFSHSLSSPCYCFSLILIPVLSSPLWHCCTLLCFILRSPLRFKASIIFQCYLRFVFLAAHFVYIACLPCCFAFIYYCTFYSYFCLFPLDVLSRRFSFLSCSVLYLCSLRIPFPVCLVILLLTKMAHSGVSRLRINLR